MNQSKSRCKQKIHLGLPDELGAFTCWRKTWRDSEKCIWHADIEKKPISELQEELQEATEVDNSRLDEAILRNTAPTDKISFEGKSLIKADLSESALDNGEFSDCWLNGADFENSSLSLADFRGSTLASANFKNAHLNVTDLRDTDCIDAIFTGAHLMGTKFDGAGCDRADFSEVNGFTVSMKSTYMQHANFDNSTLVGLMGPDITIIRSSFQNCDLANADLSDADISDSNFDGANCRNVNFWSSRIEGNNFNNANFIGADLKHAEYFGCQLSGVRVDIDTDLGEKSGYEPTSGKKDLQKAEWCYRNLQSVLEQHSLSEQARKYYNKRKNKRRERYSINGTWQNREWWLATISKFTTGYGDRPKNVIATSVATIILFGLIYPFIGGIRLTSSNTPAISFDPLITVALNLPEFVLVFLSNIYFSAVTFTTLGYGDIEPASPAMQFLASVESFIGALLMALLVFVLGRRATW